MLPVIQVGSWTFSTYALMYALAALVGGSIAFSRLGGLGGAAELWRKGTLLAIAALLIGLWLPSLIETRLHSWLTGQPAGPLQMRVYYGLGLGILVFFLYCRAHHLPILKAFDRLMPPFALAYAIARLGCLAAGCCGGAETAMFLGLPAPDEHGEWANRYPTQLASGLFQLALGLLALRLDPWHFRAASPPRPAWLRRDGLIHFGYLFLFALERFSLDFLRADYTPLWGALSFPQACMIVVMAAALFGLTWQARRGWQV